MNKQHGQSNTRLYYRWYKIKKKCYLKSEPTYKYYGARGIKMYKEWVSNYVSFMDYMMSLPNAMRENYTIDRIDNDGNYEPGNLRWADWHTQVCNKRKGEKNKSGYRGVCFDKSVNRYRSYIGIDRKQKKFGCFMLPEDAYMARIKFILDNNLIEYL